NATWTTTGAPGGNNPAQIFAFLHLAGDPTDTRTAVAVTKGFTGINPVNPTGHVFLTRDAGAPWTDITGTPGNLAANRPDLRVNTVVWDPNPLPHSIIVGNDAKVLRTLDLGRTWQILGLGLPNISCRSLAIHPDVNPPVLRVATYGRSVFELGASQG